MFFQNFSSHNGSSFFPPCSANGPSRSNAIVVGHQLAIPQRALIRQWSQETQFELPTVDYDQSRLRKKQTPRTSHRVVTADCPGACEFLVPCKNRKWLAFNIICATERGNRQNSWQKNGETRRGEEKGRDSGSKTSALRPFPKRRMTEKMRSPTRRINRRNKTPNTLPTRHSFMPRPTKLLTTFTQKLTGLFLISLCSRALF